VLYIISMAALFKLRATEPAMERPFKAPLYPVFPAIALVLSVFFLVVMTWFNPGIALIFALMFAPAYGYFLLTAKNRAELDIAIPPSLDVAPTEGLLARGDTDI